MVQVVLRQLRSMNQILHGKVISNTNSEMLILICHPTQLGNKFNGLMLRMVLNYKYILNLIILLEHFIVWMRTAGLPNFRKLWGRLESDMLPGTYRLDIQNSYDVNSFSGKKSYVFSTTNALGGKNYFLAICYLVVGSLCIVFAIIFMIAFCRKNNQDKQA